MGVWTDPMRGARIFLIALCVAFLVGGIIHRQRSSRPIAFIPGADSAQTALFKKLANEPPPSDSIWAKININQASARELIALPGIGPVKAESIVEYRLTHGPFQRPNELLNVYGIGPKTLQKITPLISLDTTDTLHRKSLK